MRCDEFRDLFSEYYDSEAFEEDKMAAHLRDCAECALEYQEFCSLMEEIHELPEPELPSGFHDELMKGVRKHEAKTKQRKKRTYRNFVLAAAASVVLVAIVAFSGIMNQRTGNFGDDWIPQDWQGAGAGGSFAEARTLDDPDFDLGGGYISIMPADGRILPSDFNIDINGEDPYAMSSDALGEWVLEFCEEENAYVYVLRPVPVEEDEETDEIEAIEIGAFPQVIE